MNVCIALLRLVAASFLLATASAAGAAEEPEAVFGKFHRALQSGNFADLMKYGTATGGAEMAKLPPDQRKAMLDMIKKLVPSSYTITGKEGSPDGNRMVLRATGTGMGLLSGKPETQYGMITLLKQGGEWKVDESKWDNTRPAASAATAPAASTPTPAAVKAPAEPTPAVVKKAAPKPAAPAAAKAETPAAPAPAQVLGEGRPPCVYKPVMTDAEIARCR